MSTQDIIEDFPVAPLGKAARVFLASFTVVLPMMILVAMAAFPDYRPAPAVFLLAALVIVAVAVALLVASRRRSIRIDGDRLEIRATFYSRSVALTAIDLDAGRIIDLREHPETRPLLKTNGYSLPGMLAGNFRDRRGNRLFCLVTAPRVVMLPLSNDHRILVSPSHPERFLKAVRDRAGFNA